MILPLRPLHPRLVAAQLRSILSPTPKMKCHQTAVLNYHGVVAESPKWINTRFVSARRFRNDIRALKKIEGLRFVTFDQALDHNEPGPKVAITFDDGYRCLLQNVVPVLEDAQVPATFFITTIDAEPSIAANQRVLWADRLDLAAFFDHPAFQIDGEHFVLNQSKRWLRAEDGYPLKRLCIERDIAFLRKFAHACSPPVGLAPYWELLKPEELRELARHPLISLGSHGVSHANLPSLTVDDRIWELKVSKNWLENHTQQPTTSFAYPHGEYSEACIQLARTEGYQTQAMLDFHVTNHMSAPDLSERIGIHPRCGSTLQRKIIARGGYK